MSAGEFDLIEQIVADLPESQYVTLGPGDDAAVLVADSASAVSTDLMVEDVHFRRAWSSAHDVGRKVVAVNVADIEAMGARPRAIVIALGLSAELEPDWVKEFSAGVRAECDAAGVSLVGGDLSRAAKVVICGTAMGAVTGEPVTRSGAQPGDVVAYCGRLGWAAAGLSVLQRGFRSPASAIAEQRTPSVPYGQGRIAAECGATAMIDISDGLLADLGHISEKSGVAIDIETEALEVPDVVERVSAATGKNPWQFVLAGGEDHALAAAFPRGATLPQGWRRIGTVSRGDGLTVDGKAWEEEKGWDHFRSG